MGLESKSAPVVRAAQYVRMSTDHQQYSTANQSDAICAYAAKHGMEIVRTYTDEGKSGVVLGQRDGLRRLIEEVLTGTADFRAILVYDVSRWGRFQDPDEAAYHEFICKRAGIIVHYCAEQFQNDGSSLAAIVKNIKRTMAGEYSRELSVKVFAGQVRLFNLGFRQGALAPFGTCRLLVDQSGAPKFVLGYRERKSIQTDRVVLIPGPSEEIKLVRWIFRAFVRRKVPVKAIVRMLNAKGISNGLGRPWAYHKVDGILKNEIYIGNYIWNRSSIKLGAKLVHNSPETWLRSKCGFKAIVDRSLFESAQTIIRDRFRRLTDEEKLAPLRRLLRKHGYLDTRLITENAGVPSTTAYAKWFGSLRGAYKLVGYEGPAAPLSDDELLQRLRRLFKAKGDLSESIIDKSGLPNSSTYRKRFGCMSRAYQLIGFKVKKDTRRGKREATLALSNDELLVALQALLRKRRRLSGRIIAKSNTVPSAPTYARRFGSLRRAYALVGYRG